MRGSDADWKRWEPLWVTPITMWPDKNAMFRLRVVRLSFVILSKDPDCGFRAIQETLLLMYFYTHLKCVFNQQPSLVRLPL